MTYSAIDLFAGAGGLSLGLSLAGFDVVAAIEVDDWAAQTFQANHPSTNLYQEDITKLSSDFFRQFRGVDIVAGGPPCQGFSIAASNRRDPDDPRNYLYRDFLRAVNIIQPKAVLIENVKGLRKFRTPTGTSILNEIVSELESQNYAVGYAILNAAQFGVPQNRERFFMIAILVAGDNYFKALNDIQAILHFNNNNTLTLWDAISDLPEVKPREFDEGAILSYGKSPMNPYQRLMRGSCTNIYNHIPMRHTKRTIERFAYISATGSKEQLPDDLACRQRSNSDQISRKSYDQNHRRLNPSALSPTITASFYSSFIHPFQHRNITVREAARIQSFPDKYRFYGKRTRLSKKLLARKGIFEDIHLDQFNQVGNAVPPWLAKGLAQRINEYLEKK